MTTLNIAAREHIRRLRKKQKLTLSKLAKRCNCSPSFLSRVETGAANPSLATLMSIARELGVKLDELFYGKEVGDEISPCVISPSKRKTLILRDELQIQLLSRGAGIPIEFMLVKLPPETSDGIGIFTNDEADLHTHEGVECGLLLQGTLDVHVEDKIYHLKPGDAITINSNTPHKLSNTGKEEALAVWVDSRPFFFSSE